MPELPEIRAHAERIDKALAGRTLSQFQLFKFASLKTFDPPADAALGTKLVAVTSRAKLLILRFENDLSHVVHLMQGGRLRPDAGTSKRPRAGICRWTFEDDTTNEDDTTSNASEPQAWLLTEQGSERKAGVWSVNGDPLVQQPLAKLGPDADGLSTKELADVLLNRSARLHGVLRDQKTVAGLGRMLANEICYAAKISPFVNTSKLKTEDIERIQQSISDIIAGSVEHERTLDDIGKSVDRPSKVHNRADQKCLNNTCGDTIRTVSYRNYTVYYCPTEQTGGKLLADNTTSKFLK